MIIAAWSGLTLIAPGVKLGRKLTIAGGAIVTAVVAFAVFVGLNPFMTARPPGPLRPDLQDARQPEHLAALRLSGEASFPVIRKSEDQLSRTTPSSRSLEKTEVFAVQGFGRFGLLGPSQSDSTVRFDRRQDWGAILWAPLVFYGLVTSIRLGVASTEPASRRPRSLWSSGPSWRGPW